MAQIYEELPDQGAEAISEIEAVEQSAAPPPEESTVEDTIPEKYRGKSVADIVKMHQEAEKLIGKQAQEVGEVRRLADELLKQQLSKKDEPTPQTQEVDEIDFFEDPKKAIAKAVQEHPDVKAARIAALQMQQQQARVTLASKHPDMAEIIGDGEFIDWVKQSPVRMQLFQAADARYDINAADELLSTFKQIRTAKATKTVEAGKQMRQADMKAAAVDVSGTGESSKKVYRRADLIRLRMTDPSRYEALQDEIMSAYAEGRVR